MSVILFLLLSVADARVFDFKQQKLGTYLKGNLSTSTVANSAYSDSSGTGVVFPAGPKYNWGGELGFIYNTNLLGIRIGYDFVTPLQQSIDGKDAAGTTVVTLTSSIVGAFPVAHVELYLGATDTSRFTIALGGGFGSVTLNNSYSYFTAKSPYTAVGTATTYIAEIAGGYEFLMSGNVTMNLEAGYRVSPITNFVADSTFQDVYGRTIVKGSNLKNADNSDISMTLNGYWLGIGFTFYFVGY